MKTNTISQPYGFVVDKTCDNQKIMTAIKILFILFTTLDQLQILYTGYKKGF